MLQLILSTTEVLLLSLEVDEATQAILNTTGNV